MPLVYRTLLLFGHGDIAVKDICVAQEVQYSIVEEGKDRTRIVRRGKRQIRREQQEIKGRYRTDEDYQKVEQENSRRIVRSRRKVEYMKESGKFKQGRIEEKIKRRKDSRKLRIIVEH